MQDHAIRLTHLSKRNATAFTGVTLPGGFAVAAGTSLSSWYFIWTFDYSRVKFVVHYFPGGCLSESDHSLLNSAGTAARTADAHVRARSVSVVQLSVQSSGVTLGSSSRCVHFQTNGRVHCDNNAYKNVLKTGHSGIKLCFFLRFYSLHLIQLTLTHNKHSTVPL